MKLKCLVIDDEPLAREVITSHIQKIDGLELVAECDNALKAFEWLKKEPIDLLFLDIQMPKLTGIEFIKVLNPNAQIIFTTAYREYALESYELNVADYLLKPISFNRFLKAVNKVLHVQQEEPQPAQEPDALRTDEPHIFLKADRKMVKVYLKDILYIESLKDYVRIKLQGKEVISLQKISFLEEKLPEDCFMRVHRSFIVPLKKIEAFSNNAIEVNGVEIPIGRNYKDKVLEQLNSSKSILG
ncbi:LytR/AlgR family response regulator transcription factor [Roseivirga sp.]|uniref:LytR/AlgR family response regulator transcription factor n=1 Tax=Roseivirga sp. TaxID=1964215 RepID=UPI003B52C27D